MSKGTDNKKEKANVAKQKVTEKQQNVKSKQEKKSLTASQRLSMLEDLMLTQRDQINILADEIDKVRNIMTSLSKRLNATIKAGQEGNLSDEAINEIVVKGQVEELEGKVNYLVSQGVLQQSTDKDASISESVFVVGRQLDENSNVISPRVQFAVSTLDDSLKTKLIGKKLGDVIADESSGTSFEIVEIYNIVDPKVNKKFDDQDDSSSKSSTAATKKSKKSKTNQTEAKQ